MFTREIIESLFFIAVLTAAIVWYGVATGRKEDRDAGSRSDTSERSHAAGPAGPAGHSNHESHRETA